MSFFFNGHTYKKKFEPIVEVESNMMVGLEILSITDSNLSNEHYFSSLDDDTIKNLCIEQLSSSKEKQKEMKKNAQRMFINVRFQNLSDDIFIDCICDNAQCKVALEVDYASYLSGGSINQKNLIKLLKSRHEIWLDDFIIDDKDDFSILYNFRFHGVKIDKHNFWSIPRKKLKRKISLLHQYVPYVLVEGVETNEQRILCINSGADFVQGYFWSTVYD